MTHLENRTVLCAGELVPLFVIHNGQKFKFDRTAYIDEQGAIPLPQMRVDEILKAPCAIYRKY